jgi:hypothetical protein
VGESPKNYVKEQRRAASSEGLSFQAFEIIIILNLSILCLTRGL